MENTPKTPIAYYKASDMNSMTIALIAAIAVGTLQVIEPAHGGVHAVKEVATLEDVKQFIGGEFAEISADEFNETLTSWGVPDDLKSNFSGGTAPNPQNIDGAGGADQAVAQPEPTHDGGSDPSPAQDAGGADTSPAAGEPIEQTGPEPEDQTNAA